MIIYQGIRISNVITIFGALFQFWNLSVTYGTASRTGHEILASGLQHTVTLCRKVLLSQKNLSTRTYLEKGPQITKSTYKEIINIEVASRTGQFWLTDYDLRTSMIQKLPLIFFKPK